jgi:hypothetical protein
MPSIGGGEQADHGGEGAGGQYLGRESSRRDLLEPSVGRCLYQCGVERHSDGAAGWRMERRLPQRGEGGGDWSDWRGGGHGHARDGRCAVMQVLDLRRATWVARCYTPPPTG